MEIWVVFTFWPSWIILLWIFEWNYSVYTYFQFFWLCTKEWNCCAFLGLPQWFSGKESTCDAEAAGDMGLIPGSGRSLGGDHGNPQVFLPGEFHGPRTLAGYSPWDYKESRHSWMANIFTFFNGNSIFNFWNNCQTILYSSCTILHFHQQYMRFPFLHILTNTCNFFLSFSSFFFFFGHSMRHGGNFPNQRSNACPLQWKHGVLTTGPPGKSQHLLISVFW